MITITSVSLVRWDLNSNRFQPLKANGDFLWIRNIRGNRFILICSDGCITSAIERQKTLEIGFLFSGLIEENEHLILGKHFRRQFRNRLTRRRLEDVWKESSPELKYKMQRLPFSFDSFELISLSRNMHDWTLNWIDLYCFFVWFICYYALAACVFNLILYLLLLLLPLNLSRISSFSLHSSVYSFNINFLPEHNAVLVWYFDKFHFHWEDATH